MVRALYMACLCILCTGIVVAQGEWDIVGFPDSRITRIAQHPSDTALMYTAIDDSVYRSTDGGETWTYAVSFNDLPVNDLQFHPVDPDMICALVGDGSWSDGIYCSTDAGYSWDVRFYFYKPLALTIPQDSSSLWVVGCDTFGVYKSTDNGVTWTLWNEGLTNLHINTLSHTWRSDTLVFLAGTGQGLFYRSTDAWSPADGISDMLPVVSIIHHPIGAYGCAAVGNGSYSDGIYQTADYGETWQVAEWWVYPSCVTMTEMWDVPRDTCTVLAGDSGLGVKRSMDYGGSWYEMNAGLDNLFINDLSYHRQTSMRLFAGTDEGLYRYDHGSSCAEQAVEQLPMRLMVNPSIVCSGQPIRITVLPVAKNGMLPESVGIYDVCGRLLSTVSLRDGACEISLRLCGTFVMQVSGVPDCPSRKIVVVK
jgi:hypothetical protein